jgi:hypothetical protein
VGDGIERLSDADHEELLRLHHEAAQAGWCHWFVPASGAASRMFKDLIASAAPPVPDKSRKKKPVENPARVRFLQELRRFPFYSELERAMPGGAVQIAQLAESGDYVPLLDAMLSPSGLGYADRPKGLLPFHAYEGVTCTAFEEHLVEAGPVVRDASQHCRLHFTVSTGHEESFRALLDRVRGRYELQLGVHYDVGFSTQNPATDTLSLDEDGRLFRDSEGLLLFRPGGHGALIGNLQALNAPIVFLKNIDNVTTAQRNTPTVLWSRLLIGLLLKVQRRTFDLLRRLESESGTAAVHEALDFASTTLGSEPHAGVVASSATRARSLAVMLLERPLRVCGMVPNAGEPGGGPYWVKGHDGQASLQVIEGAQLENATKARRKKIADATHFNPVFMACGMRDRNGKAFDLGAFVDPDAVIVTRKSHAGRDLVTLERPGLWNGAMAHWNTIFVEVPQEVFNPVKTVNDLLRTEHQPGGGER